MPILAKSYPPLRFSCMLLASETHFRSLARGIGADNMVVGLGWEHTGSEAGLLWQRMGAATVLEASVQGRWQACAVTERGIVGSGSLPGRPCYGEALYWERGCAAAQRLHPEVLLGPESSSCAVALHQSRIVGSGEGSRYGQNRQALVWIEPHAACAHRLHPESLLGGESFSHAQSIEDEWIVGYGRGTATQDCDQALLWQDAGPVDVLNLHPKELLGGEGISYAMGISQKCVVGYGRGAATQRSVQALYWHQPEPEARSLHPEALLGAQSSSWAVAISGPWIAGYGRSTLTGHECHALVWWGPDPACALNLHGAAPVGARTSRAYGVSPSGVVVGCIDDQAALWIPHFS